MQLSVSRTQIAILIVCLSICSPFITSSLAALIQPGNLLISEFMANPSAVTDANGEWFEVFNASNQTLDLNGLRLHDAGSDSHTITHGGPLNIASGQYFVFGRNGNTGTNGGYTADYVYSGFVLANFTDEIIISQGTTTIAQLNYTSVTNGVSAALTTSIPPLPSTSLHYANTPSGFIYGSGDKGTPGIPGSTALVATPAPSALLLMASGLIGLVVWRWRK